MEMVGDNSTRIGRSRRRRYRTFLGRPPGGPPSRGPLPFGISHQSFVLMQNPSLRRRGPLRDTPALRPDAIPPPLRGPTRLRRAQGSGLMQEMSHANGVWQVQHHSGHRTPLSSASSPAVARGRRHRPTRGPEVQRPRGRPDDRMILRWPKGPRGPRLSVMSRGGPPHPPAPNAIRSMQEIPHANGV